MVRVMSNPNYSGATSFTAEELLERLDQFARHSDHEFWADDVSLRDQLIFARDRLHSSRTITDIYLLGLAVKHKGALITFDQTIPSSTVPGAKTSNLCTL